MIKESYKLIKNLRNGKGLSQEEISEKLGISRSSYIAFEQGKTELDFSKMARLADILGISLEEVESGSQADYDKYKEMILAYLRQAVSRDNNILKTKLAKMLYLADFSWFYENLESMSGMQYRCIKYGPVPDGYFRAIDELEEEGRIKIIRKDEMLLISENNSSRKRSLEKIKTAEMDLIKKISQKWKDKSTKEIVDFTHSHLPYKICSSNEIIPYELITQEDPGYVY